MLLIETINGLSQVSLGMLPVLLLMVCQTLVLLFYVFIFQTYQQSSRTDQFVTRFLMGELMNQICALQHPLDSATEALDQQAKDERLGE